MSESPIYELTAQLGAVMGPSGAIETVAQAYDAILGDWAGNVLREGWRLVLDGLFPRSCDCDPLDFHRWNCSSTPIWAQTIRDLDTNPWTVFRSAA